METTAVPGGPLYSPRQIFWATFFGGPFALTWLLARNFNALARPAEARQYSVVGVLASLALLVALVMLPGR